MDANAPYLPPPEANENPPVAKKSAKRTLLLWIVLIAMFMAIYQFLGTTPPSHHVVHAPPPPPAHPDPLWNALVGFLPSFALIALFVLYLRRQFKGGSKLNAKLEPGNLALADGDLGRAADVFAAVAHEYRKQTSYAAAAKLSLSTALMRQGELQRAIEAAIEVERAPGLLSTGDTRTIACTHLALLYALRGQLDAATRWCEAARRRLPRGQTRTYTAALLRVAELVTLARSGQSADATRAFDRDAGRLEEALPVTSVRKAWLLRAFLAASDGTRATVEPWLTLARSGRPRELRWLATEWPELRAFLDAHDL